MEFSHAGRADRPDKWRDGQIDLLCSLYPDIGYSLQMYRHTTGPRLIIRCTDSGAPGVLDLELDALCDDNGNVTVRRMPLAHLAPAWDAIDEVPVHIESFLHLLD